MKSVHTPEHWQQILRGPYLFEQIQARLYDWAPSLFGFNLLKVDGLSAPCSLAGSRLRHAVQMNQQDQTAIPADLIGQATDMPFAPKSLDACLLSHVLDFSAHPHAILREVETVLRDDGWLIISGFNPYSSAGLASILPGLHHKLPKWRGMVSPGRLEDWLKLLGFEVIKRDYINLTPLFNFSLLNHCRQQLSEKSIPNCAAVYLIMARKRRYPLTPIRQAQPTRQILQPGMARQQQQLNVSVEHQAKTQTIFATESAEPTEK